MSGAAAQSIKAAAAIAAVANARGIEDIAAAVSKIVGSVRTERCSFRQDTASGEQLKTEVASHSHVVIALPLLVAPLWPKGITTATQNLWSRFRNDLKGIDPVFAMWVEWYQERINGADLNVKAERQQIVKRANEYFTRK